MNESRDDCKFTPERTQCERKFTGYGCLTYSQRNPTYKCTSMDFGWFPPNAHTAPFTYHPSSNKFTELLGKAGMYRNTSLNTGMDPQGY